MNKAVRAGCSLDAEAFFRIRDYRHFENKLKQAVKDRHSAFMKRIYREGGYGNA